MNKGTTKEHEERAGKILVQKYKWSPYLAERVVKQIDRCTLLDIIMELG